MDKPKMKSFDCQHLFKDADLEIESAIDIKEIMQTRINPLNPKKLYIFTTPTKKEQYGQE